MPTGAGSAAGPFHSQSNEAWFFHTPGLKIVYPSSVEDAKGLLNAAIEDPNPVMFFEHKNLYRSIKEEISDDYYTVEIGKAKTVREGDDLTIITYGMGVHWAKEILDKHPKIKAELIDLRTLLPLDTESIYKAVRKTGKVIVLHEDCMTGGIGGELVALINENCFKDLDAKAIPSAIPNWGPKWEIIPTKLYSCVPKWKERSLPFVNPDNLPWNCANNFLNGISLDVKTPKFRCIGRIYSSLFIA